jgi:hypothetical protein
MVSIRRQISAGISFRGRIGVCNLTTWHFFLPTVADAATSGIASRSKIRDRIHQHLLNDRG